MTATDKKEQANSAHLPSKNWFTVFGPLLLSVIVALLVAAAGASQGWHKAEILTAAMAALGIGGLLATAFLYVQVKGREAGRQDLLALEIRVSSILESAMDPVITMDEQQRIVLFNKAAENVFRWPRQAVIGQQLEMLMPERFRDTHKRHVQHFGETGTTSRRMGANIVLNGVRADGEEFPIEASISQHAEGSRKFYTVILRDITQRVKAEDSLAQSEAMLRSVLDSAMDAIITIDESQHIVMFNQAAELVFGCPREQALGAPLSWLLPDRFRAGHGDHIRRFGEAGTSSRRMSSQRVVMGLRGNGQEFPIEASISQIVQNGQRYYTVILRDITERQQADQALRNSKSELQEMALAAHSVREQEKNRIARELHDELGQGLTALKMDIAWLREQPHEANVGERLADMESMLNRTITSTRRISTELRPLILDDLGLVAAVEWLTQNFSERCGIPCHLTLSDPEPDLHDPLSSAVFRIVQESLTNIAKHARANEVEVRLELEGNVARVVIKDDGVGFIMGSPRKQNSYGLLGLRERAYLLGGATTIHSAPGQGTTVEVRIPLHAEAIQ